MATFFKVGKNNRSAAKSIIGYHSSMQSSEYRNLRVGQLGKALSLINSGGYMTATDINDALNYGFARPTEPKAQHELLQLSLTDLTNPKKDDTTMQPFTPVTPTLPTATTDSRQAAIDLLLNSNNGLSAEQVNALIDDKIAHIKPMPLGIDLTVNAEPVQTSEEYHHEQFKEVLGALLTKEPVYLWGTASGGKTTMYKQLSASLSAIQETDIPLITSVQLFTQFEIVGYKDATGTMVNTIFRKWFEDGGLLAIDEFDRSTAKALTALNQMIENRFFTFPDNDEPQAMNDNSFFIASGNTPLNGNGSGKYSAAEAIDGATRDRFIAIEFKFDKHIETIMSSNNNEWLNTVRTIRASAVELGIEIIVSTRPIRQGAKLLAAGWNRSKVIESTILKGLASEQAVKLLNHAGVR